MCSPLSWQVEAVRTLAAAIGEGRSVLDASDTGTGKTFQALFAVKTAGKQVAVICPKSVIPAWREACQRVGVDALFIQNVEALKFNKDGCLRKTGKVWSWNLPEDVVLVVDEVHRFSGSDTENAKILAAAPQPCLMLSATAAGDPTRMRAIGHQLGLTTWTQWWHWCGRNGCQKRCFGGIEFKGTQAHLDNLHRQIFNTGRGVRVRIADLGDQFPENRIEVVAVPVQDQTGIDTAYLEEMQALETNAAQAMEASLRARQIAEHQKLPAILELAEDLIDSGNSVVVFVHFRDSLDRIHQAFPDSTAIHGEQTAEQRQQCIGLFQADESRVMVCMIQAGGVGLSLHDVNGRRPRVSLICPGWSAVELRQALGRTHRAGAKSPCLQKIIFAEGTIEERIRRKVETKLANIDLLNDGDLSAATSAQTTKGTMKDNGNGTTESQGLLPALSGPDTGGPVAVPKVQNHSGREHSKISPSRLKNLELCPGYADDPKADVHPLTAEGTLCHEALESGDDSKLTTDEQRAWVKMCRDYESDLIRDHFKKVLREERLEIIPGMWGFADNILLDGTPAAAALIDYKFGANAQEDCETNPAAQAYVLGMFQRWPALETIDVHYLYPRRDEVSHAKYTRKDMARIRLRIETIVARAQAGVEHNYHPDVCTWCSNKATCATLHQHILPIAARYAAHKGLEIPPVPDFSLVKDPGTWSKLMAAAPVLEATAESIKRHAIEFRQQSGIEIPGYELRSRMGRKTINNALIAWQVASKEGLTQQHFLSAVDVSAKRLADAVGENAPRGQKAKKAAELEGKLRDNGVLELGAETFYLARSK